MRRHGMDGLAKDDMDRHETFSFVHSCVLLFLLIFLGFASRFSSPGLRSRVDANKANKASSRLVRISGRPEPPVF